MTALSERHALPKVDTDTPPESRAPRLHDARKPSLRILVAEDNPVHRAYLLQLLVDMGHRPTAAINGQEAMDMLSASRFDIVFLDLRMPVLDGEEVLRAVRAGRLANVSREVPVVAVTAQNDRGLRARLSAAGFDGFIGKPLRRVDVLKAMQLVQDGQGQQAVDLDLARGWLCSGDDSIFRRILAIFLEQVVAFPSEMAAALKSGDAVKIRFGAHSLANSAGMLRAEPLRVVCLALEKAAEAGDLDMASAMLPRAKLEIEPVAIAVRAYMDGS